MRALKRLLRGGASVEVSEAGGVRTLHLGGDAIQSAMRLSRPDRLELAYTQAMMASLLFVPEPKAVTMIGLGGGSIARFLHRYCPSARTTVVEISPKVVAAARSFFGLPADDGRLEVVVGDGAKFVPAHPASADLLLVDGFDDGVAVKSLCSAAFYDAAYECLHEGGLLVQNFIAEEPRFGTYLARIEARFGGRVLLLPAADRVNNIVLAAKAGPSRYSLARLQARARLLGRRLDLPFGAFLRDLADHNDATANYLRFASTRAFAARQNR